MFDEIKRIVDESRKHNNKNGFQIIVKNLDNGEEVVNCLTKAIIGAYETESPEGGAVAAKGLIITSCNTPTLMGVIKAAEETVTDAKKKLIEGLPPEIILAALLSGGKS